MTKKKHPLANLVFKRAYDKERVLLHKDGTAVKIGDTVTDFRGETDIVTGWKHDGQNKMYVKGGEFYPSVFGLKWAD